MNVRDIPDRPLDPPEPSIDELLEIEAWEQRQQDAYETTFVEAINGGGNGFWNDEHVEILAAVRAACADSELHHERRWQLVFAAVEREAQRYAAAVAEDID